MTTQDNIFFFILSLSLISLAHTNTRDNHLLTVA